MKNINEFPTYYDIKFSQTSKIFESEEIRGLTPDQIKEGEKAYYVILEKLEKGEEIDEGVLTGLIGGLAGGLVGPTIGRAICSALGINVEGVLGKLLTSKLVLASIGYALGK